MEDGTVVRQSTNGMAIASLVLGILWLGGLGAIAALIFGTKARNQIEWANGLQGGRGMAVAGIVLGWVGIAGAVLYWAAIIIAAAHSGSAGAS
jgi:hypothetical protein